MKPEQIKELIFKIKEGDLSQEDFVNVLKNLDVVFSHAKREDNDEAIKKIYNMVSSKALFVEDYNDIMNSSIKELKEIALNRFERDGVPTNIETTSKFLHFSSSVGPILALPLNKGALLVENRPVLSVNSKLYFLVSDAPIALAFKTIGTDFLYGRWVNDGFELENEIFGVKRVTPNGAQVFNQSVRNTGNKIRGKIVLSEDFEGGIRMDAAVLSLSDIVRIKTTESMQKMAKGFVAAGIAATIVGGTTQAHATNAGSDLSNEWASQTGQMDYIIDSTSNEVENSLLKLRERIHEISENEKVSEIQINNLLSRIDQIQKKLVIANSAKKEDSYKKAQSNFALADKWAKDFIKDPLNAVKGKISTADFKELEIRMGSVSESLDDASKVMQTKLTNVVTY